MATQNGIWLYQSIERQGSYRLVLVPTEDGKVHAQRQRFNADGSSLPLQPGDVFIGEQRQDAIDWLNQHHLQLTLRGWTQTVTAGIAKTIQLCSSKAARQEARRIRSLRRNRQRPMLPAAPAAACA